MPSSVQTRMTGFSPRIAHLRSVIFTGSPPRSGEMVPCTGRKGGGMRLSLSVRIAELENRKDHAFMPIEELAPLAREVGFAGLSMRASVVSVDSPPERAAEVRRVLDERGLAVSMVTGDVALA